MKSKYVDIPATVQVIGAIYKNPDILDNEEYHFCIDDFVEEFHQIIFGSIYNLHQLGAKEITSNTIEDYLENKPKKLAIFRLNKGDEYLSKISETAQVTAFPFYYNRIKKMTLLRMYNEKCGMDLSWLYDVDNILDVKKKQAQEDWLDNSSLEEIADIIDKKIDNIKNLYISNNNSAIQGISNGVDQLIANLKSSPEIGYPLYGSYINTITRGARLKKFYLRSAATGVGKAIPDSELIPTPLGWRCVRDIKIGDYLFDRQGKPTKVLNIFPQAQLKEMWEIIFEDGRSTRCCYEHLWQFKYDDREVVAPFSDLHQQYLKNKDIYLPLNEAVEYNFFHVENPYDLGIKFVESNFTNNLDKITYSSIKERYEFLRGVFDKAGNVKNNKILLKNNSYSRLFILLIESLGIKVIEENNFLVLYCKKKQLKYFVNDNFISLLSNFKECNYIKIKEIKHYNFRTKMTCFTVDNEEHLFLVSEYIVTHNTRAMIADACYIGCSCMYDLKTKNWVQTGEPQPTLYIATEQSIDEIQTMMLAFLSGVNEEHILINEYVDDEQERIQYAINVLKSSKIYFESLPDFSLQDIEDTIKKGIREYNTHYIFHDYLHTSMKILEEITKKSGGVKLREDNILFMISIRLKDLCNKYDSFIMTSTQLNGDFKSAKEYDQNLLRGAKSIADKIDVGMIMLEVTQDDREILSDLCLKNGLDMPDIKISFYKNRRGKWKNVLLWCKSDRGICRIDPIFATKYNYELIELEDYKININSDFDISAF